MTDRQRNVDSEVPEAPPGLPRWVKLLALGTVIVVAVLIVAMLLIGGDHGPGMHGG
jgi:hypothetical protein